MKDITTKLTELENNSIALSVIGNLLLNCPANMQVKANEIGTLLICLSDPAVQNVAELFSINEQINELCSTPLEVV